MKLWKGASIYQGSNEMVCLTSITSEVATHIHLEQPEHSVELENTEILTTESRWFERGGEGSHLYKSFEPKPQQRRWKFLPPVRVNNIIKKRMKANRPKNGGGGGGQLISIITDNVPNDNGVTRD